MPPQLYTTSGELVANFKRKYEATSTASSKTYITGIDSFLHGETLENLRADWFTTWLQSGSKNGGRPPDIHITSVAALLKRAGENKLQVADPTKNRNLQELITSVTATTYTAEELKERGAVGTLTSRDVVTHCYEKHKGSPRYHKAIDSFLGGNELEELPGGRFATWKQTGNNGKPPPTDHITAAAALLNLARGSNLQVADATKNTNLQTLIDSVNATTLTAKDLKNLGENRTLTSRDLITHYNEKYNGNPADNPKAIDSFLGRNELVDLPGNSFTTWLQTGGKDGGKPPDRHIRSVAALLNLARESHFHVADATKNTNLQTLINSVNATTLTAEELKDLGENRTLTSPDLIMYFKERYRANPDYLNGVNSFLDGTELENLRADRFTKWSQTGGRDGVKPPDRRINSAVALLTLARESHFHVADATKDTNLQALIKSALSRRGAMETVHNPASRESEIAAGSVLQEGQSFEEQTGALYCNIDDIPGNNYFVPDRAGEYSVKINDPDKVNQLFKQFSSFIKTDDDGDKYLWSSLNGLDIVVDQARHLREGNEMDTPAYVAGAYPQTPQSAQPGLPLAPALEHGEPPIVEAYQQQTHLAYSDLQEESMGSSIQPAPTAQEFPFSQDWDNKPIEPWAMRDPMPSSTEPSPQIPQQPFFGAFPAPVGHQQQYPDYYHANNQVQDSSMAWTSAERPDIDAQNLSPATGYNNPPEIFSQAAPHGKKRKANDNAFGDLCRDLKKNGLLLAEPENCIYEIEDSAAGTVIAFYDKDPTKPRPKTQLRVPLEVPEEYLNEINIHLKYFEKFPEYERLKERAELAQQNSYTGSSHTTSPPAHTLADLTLDRQSRGVLAADRGATELNNSEQWGSPTQRPSSSAQMNILSQSSAQSTKQQNTGRPR